MSHLTNEIVTQAGIVVARATVADKMTSGTASITSGLSVAGGREAATTASTKDFGRVRIGGCCIRY